MAQVKLCKTCEKDISHRSKLAQYCNRSCRSKAERVRRLPYIKEYMKGYQKRRIRNKEYDKKYNYTYYRDNWGNSIINQIRSRCKKRGLDFNLEVSDLIVPDICPILNIPIKVGDYKYNSPSVDRIDNSKGYIKSNIQIISMSANAMKSDMPLDIWNKFKGRWTK